MIPSSVPEIGDRAFDGCRRPTSVTIPSSVTKIGDSFFHGCSCRTSVTIPSSVTKIGLSAFAGCEKLHPQTRNDIDAINSAALGDSGSESELSGDYESSGSESKQEI